MTESSAILSSDTVGVGSGVDSLAKLSSELINGAMDSLNGAEEPLGVGGNSLANGVIGGVVENHASLQPIINRPFSTLFNTVVEPPIGEFITDAPIDTIPLESLSSRSEEMFGAGSTLASDIGVTLSELATAPFTSQSVLLTSMVMLCFVSYSLILYYYRVQLYSLLSIFRGKMYLNNLLDSQNLLFNHFLRLVTTLGLFTLSIAIFKCTSLFFPQISQVFLAFTPMSWVANIIPLAILFAVCVVWLYQGFALKLISRSIPNGELVSRLFRMRRLFFALASIVSTPIILLFIFADGVGLFALLVSYLCFTVFIVVVFIIRTLVLFLGQGVSISYWFLYLCAVEIFPISFFVALALRNW